MKRVLHTALAALTLAVFTLGCGQPGSNVPTSNKQPEVKPDNSAGTFAPPEPVKEKPDKKKGK